VGAASNTDKNPNRQKHEKTKNTKSKVINFCGTLLLSYCHCCHLPSSMTHPHNGIHFISGRGRQIRGGSSIKYRRKSESTKTRKKRLFAARSSDAATTSADESCSSPSSSLWVGEEGGEGWYIHSLQQSRFSPNAFGIPGSLSYFLYWRYIAHSSVPHSSNNYFVRCFLPQHLPITELTKEVRCTRL